MFIRTHSIGHSREGQQQASGDFLILASDTDQKDSNGYEKLYACERFVALNQFGHFMMGNARIQGFTVVISGNFGNDGLPLDYQDLFTEQKKHFVKLPTELAQEYWENNSDHSGVMPALWVAKAAQIARDHRYGKTIRLEYPSLPSSVTASRSIPHA